MTYANTTKFPRAKSQNFFLAGGQVFHLQQRGLQRVNAARALVKLQGWEGQEAGQEQLPKESSCTVA